MPPIEIFQPEFVEFGGEERVILTLARRLHARGLDVEIICLRNQIGLERFADFPIRVRELGIGRGPLAKARLLGRHLGRRHAGGAPAPMLCNIQSAYLAGLSVRTPYHLRIPDTFRLLTPPGAGPRDRLRQIILDRLVRRGIRRADSFSTNTRALSAEMETLYRRRAEVLYLGGTPAKCAAPKQVDGPVRVLTVSRLQASKRIDWMIEAMARLALDGGDLPAWTLEIAGKGPESERLKALAADLGVSDRVSFLGFISEEDLAGAFARAHIFLMPAIQGYGIPAIEALNARLAVVLSKESGVSEILSHTPWVEVTRGTPEAFRRGVATMLTRVTATDLLRSDLPELPDEGDWADALIRLSGWAPQ